MHKCNAVPQGQHSYPETEAVGPDSHSRGENGEWEMGPSHAFYPHKLSGATSFSLCSGTLSPKAEGTSCFGEDRQFYHHGPLQQARGAEVPSVTHFGTIVTHSLEQCAPAVTESNSCARHSEFWGRSVIQGQPAVYRLVASP